MLQQTQVKTVIPYWERWMQALPTIESLARAWPEQVLKLWEGLGYYSRARNLHAAAQWLVQNHQGRFPRTFAAALALPGVGRYTAGAICSIAFNQPAPILDGNLMRVLTRLECIRQAPRQSRTQARLWHLAEQLVRQAAALARHPRNPRPKRRRTPLRLRAADTCSHLNQALMELGAVICTPRRPRCPECPVRTWCEAARRNCAASLPRTSRRPAPTAHQRIVFVIERRGRFLARQRPAHAVNGRLWEFPEAEWRHSSQRAGKANGVALDNSRSRRRGEAPACCAPRDQRLPMSAATVQWSHSYIREGNAPAPLAKLAAGELGLPLTVLDLLCDVRHAITRHRIRLRAYRAKAMIGQFPRRPDQRWLSPAGLLALPFAGAHRKIRAALLHALGH